MQFNDINEVNLKLLLLGGDSIKVDNLIIAPYILREIKEYGYSNYMENLQWVSIPIDDFIKNTKDEKKRMFLEEQTNLKAWDFYIKLGGRELQEALMNAVGMVFRTNDVMIINDFFGATIVAIDFIKKGILIYDEDDNLVINDNIMDSLGEEDITCIHRDNFDDFVKVIKLQNYLEKPSEIIKQKSENPADEATRKLMEQMKEMKEKVEAKKRKQRDSDGENDIDISEIISAVSSKSNSINILNIWDLTLYQLYDKYARLELIDNYDFSIKAMMAGAEKVDLRHWSSKI